MFTPIIDWFISDWTGVSVQLFFAYTIILMILDKQKPPVQASVLTGLALIVLGVGGSFLSSATAFVSVANGLLWLMVGYQRWNQGK
ncbi:hypothetical protein H6785_02885 [Candidatus Nomurabacteria bacterium]|nr:hypothetical protein [Candidatus Kaiserbacteria bacterium]MCB9815493.1 hypothetical protein [Candidatus Nomurabacteria bacterium]